MIIYSEILEKTFDSVDECIKAEEKATKEQAEYEKKCEEAYQKAIAACDEYLKLVGIEIEDEEDEDDCDCDCCCDCDCDDDDIAVIKAILDFFEL